MKFAAALVTLSSLALGTSAATVSVRQSQVNAEYQIFGGFNCAAPEFGDFQVSGGGNNCVPLQSNGTVQAINLSSKNLKFQFTVFEKADCSDSGTILGTGGCFSDAAGLRAFTLVPF